MSGSDDAGPSGLPERVAPTTPVPAEGADPWAFDVAAATFRLEGGDADSLFDALGAKLARILGPAATVQREGGLRRNRHVKRIVVDLDGQRLEAANGRTGPAFLAVHVVRGVTLRTEEIGADEWLGRLHQLVGQAAGRSASVREALGGLLDG